MSEPAEPGEVDMEPVGGRLWAGPGGGPGQHRGIEWWSGAGTMTRVGGGHPHAGGGVRMGLVRSGGPGQGLVRRERPSMFDHRRGR